MAVEAMRGCGYRKAGGIYLVADGPGVRCDRIPVPLADCPTCGEGVKQTRGFAWVPATLVDKLGKPCEERGDLCPTCVICHPVLMLEAEPKGQFGLIWIGEQFYPSVDDWYKEARSQGVSRRIPAIPKGFVTGKTWVLLAHPKAVMVTKKDVDRGELLKADEVEYVPGIFQVIRPNRIEVVVTPSMKKEEWVEDLVKKHDVTLVEVPENDPDHAPDAPKVSARKASMNRLAKRAAKAKK
jgi:hypothetical protein